MSEQLPQQYRGSEKILHIEDEQTIRQSVSTFLRRAGYFVLGAENGIQGVSLFQECAGQINLVLLDLDLPDLWGGDVLSRLRAMDSHVKVIVFSGVQGRVKEVEEVQARLRKPIRMATLLETVRAVLDTD